MEKKLTYFILKDLLCIVVFSPTSYRGMLANLNIFLYIKFEILEVLKNWKLLKCMWAIYFQKKIYFSQKRLNFSLEVS